MVKYIPKFGDIVFFNFDPTLGHEQKGKRPGLVISDSKYNKATQFFICCPITSIKKGYPFEVELKGHNKTSGVILVDQIRAYDINARNPKYIETIDEKTLEDVRHILKLILNF